MFSRIGAVNLVSFLSVFAMPLFVEGVGIAREQPSISKRWKFPNILSPNSLDPVSLITLFFDAPEKELLARSGDFTLLSCLGLFVNPTTAWNEYGTLYPGEGIAYYNPQRSLTSTVEIRHVHNYITRLSDGRRNQGLAVRLYPRKRAIEATFEWAFIRPLMLFGVTFVASISGDFTALSAVATLLLGQAIVISHCIKDGKTKTMNEDDPLEKNVFFLANNVTVIVESHGKLFVDACSNLGYNKLEKPLPLEIISTLIFMMGILLVGDAGLNFKIAYLVGHALQAIALSFYSKKVLYTRTLNRVTWEIGKSIQRLERRRDAYLWATEQTSGNVEWLCLWGLADPTALAYVQQHLTRSNDDESSPSTSIHTEVTVITEQEAIANETV